MAASGCDCNLSHFLYRQNRRRLIAEKVPRNRAFGCIRGGSKLILRPPMGACTMPFVGLARENPPRLTFDFVLTLPLFFVRLGRLSRRDSSALRSGFQLRSFSHRRMQRTRNVPSFLAADERKSLETTCVVCQGKNAPVFVVLVLRPNVALAKTASC